MEIYFTYKNKRVIYDHCVPRIYNYFCCTRNNATVSIRIQQPGKPAYNNTPSIYVRIYIFKKNLNYTIYIYTFRIVIIQRIRMYIICVTTIIENVSSTTIKYKNGRAKKIQDKR